MKTKTKMNLAASLMSVVMLLLAFEDRLGIPRLWFWILVLLGFGLSVVWLFFQEELKVETASEEVRKRLAPGGKSALRKQKRRRTIQLWVFTVAVLCTAPLVVPSANRAGRRAQWIGAVVMASIISAFMARRLSQLPKESPESTSEQAPGVAHRSR